MFVFRILAHGSHGIYILVIFFCYQITHEGKTHKLKGDEGPVCNYLYETLTGIQTGVVKDPYGWTVYLD